MPKLEPTVKLISMTIDERLEFLLHSTESLHASCQELHATVSEQAQIFAVDHETTWRSQQALLRGMEAYLRALDGNDETNGESDGEA